MKKLLNLEIIREELLENQHSDCEVDSTTTSTPGSSAPSSSKQRKRKLIVNKPDKGNKKDAIVSAAKKRAMELFESKSSNTETHQSSYKDAPKESNQVAELQKELQQLKELLHQKSKGTYIARHYSDLYVH